MKLKKILAAVLSAAMAVSAMAFSSLTVSADGETSFAKTNGVSAKSVSIGYTLSSEKVNNWEYDYNAVNIVVKTWNNAAASGDWLQYGVGGSAQEQYYDSGKWLGSYSGSSISSSFIANMTEYDVLDELEILYKNDGTVYSFAIKSVTAYSGFDGTGDVVWQYPASVTPSEPDEPADKPAEDVQPAKVKPAINPGPPSGNIVVPDIFRVKRINEGSRASRVRVMKIQDVMTIYLDKADNGKYANIYVGDECVDSVLIKYGRAKTKALDTEKFTVTVTDEPVIE